MSSFHCLGTKISRKDYILEETKGFYKALNKTDYARYIKSFKWSDSRYKNYIEGIEFDIKTSGFSKSNINILNTERTCVVFAEDKTPMVFALRKNFPKETLHVNLHPKDLPVSPCLYEEPYSEIRLWLTWEVFIEDIHKWYKRASDGTAHHPGQALEPLILDGAPLLVSNTFFDTEKIYFVCDHEGINVCSPIDWAKDLPTSAIILIPISTEPMLTRCIHYAPQTFNELLELTKEFGIDLREDLSEFTFGIEKLLDINIQAGQASDGIRKKCVTNEFRKFSSIINSFAGGIPEKTEAKLRNVYRQITNTVAKNKEEAKNIILSWIPMIWLRLPKKRTETGQKEWVEDIAFFASKSLGELCEKLGIYTKQNEKQDEHMIHEKTIVGKATNILKMTNDVADIMVVKPISMLNVDMAQKLSGIKREEKRYLAVGAGALGSQVITNFTRLGIGKWKIIDRDILLPHNLGRHALFSEHVPGPKADILSNQLNLLIDDTGFSESNVCDFLEFKESITDYDLIFDFSASTATVRHMAICSERPAIASAFMTKNGRYLICLYEGRDKTIRVDDIEYQLAFACVNKKEWNSVLEVHDEQEIRYSGACSDITTVLPQDRVAVHSGILSSYIRQCTEGAEPIISLWELTEDCDVKRSTISPSKVISYKKENWDIRISEVAINEMKKLRLNKLPVETGGVLIGGFDLHNKIIYIVGVVPSPKDSKEEPYSYIRGCENLKDTIKKINDISGRRLDYVGEWHTHKKGVRPSKLDKLALNEQVAEMTKAGLPGIMMIVGDEGKYNVILKHI